MIEGDIILGLFYSNENDLIYEKINYSENLKEENIEEIRSLAYKFLGPLFFSAASEEDSNWNIELIESSLSLHQDKSFNADIMQSFFILHSSKKTVDGTTHLIGIVGSPYSEDLKIIYDKIDKYIHPSINQGKIVYESILGGDFKYDNYVQEQINRGFDFINYTIGTSRKIYWETQRKYYCIGVLERIKGNRINTTRLFTFDQYSPLRNEILDFIPSFYLMSILPDYYEVLISKTLEIFDKTSIFPNIRFINLNDGENDIIYHEEFVLQEKIKKSYGVILIQENELIIDSKNISFYRKTLRNLLDMNKSLNEILMAINPEIIYKGWSVKSEEDLEQIKNVLDKRF